MSILVDSYSESNYDTDLTLLSGVIISRGQTFTATGGILNSAKFYLKTAGSPTGNVYAKIYAMTGVYGTNGAPTGAVLATSDAIDITTISSVYSLITFTFSGANKITLTNGVNYCLDCSFGGGSVGNDLVMGVDGSSPSHAGNIFSSVDDSMWVGVNTYDTCFYVYKDDTITPQTILGKSRITIATKQTLTGQSRIQMTRPLYSLYDQFTTSAPTTLVSGVSTLTNGGVITPGVGSEMNTTSNSASDPNGNETGVTTGWSTSTGITLSSDYVSPAVGASDIKGVADGTTYPRFYSSFGGSVGTWYSNTYAAKANTSSNNDYLVLTGYANPPAAKTVTTSWANYVLTGRSNSTGITFNFWLNQALNETGQLDNLSVKPLTLSSLFSTVNAGNQNVVVSAGITLTPGTQAGFVMNLDNATTPLNYVLAYHDGTNAHLVRVVNGVYQTEQVNAAAAYADGRVLTVRKNGTRYSLIYNGTQVGSDVTISDAGIINNTIHGLFSTYASNSFTNFLITTNLDGTLATDGVNARTVTDTNGKLSITGGQLSVATGTIAGNGLGYGVLTRLPGKILYGEINTSNRVSQIGWGTSQTSINDGLVFYSTPNIALLINGSLGAYIGTYTYGVTYLTATILRGTGIYYFIKGGTQYPNWTFLYSTQTSSTSNMYPSLTTGSTDAVFTADNVRIPTNLWLPQSGFFDNFSR